MKTLPLFALAAALIVSTTAADAAIVLRVPVKKPVQSVSEYNCREDMGFLRIIRPATFADSAFGSIFVQPVCEGEEAGAIRNEGNAGGLRPLIAADAAMVDALAHRDYLADEVVGVRIGGGDTLVLYVHHAR